MPRLTVFLLSSILVLSGIGEIDARRSGGFSSSRSSSRSTSSSRSSSRPKSGSTFRKKQEPKKKATVKKSTTVKSKTKGRPQSGSTFKSKKGQKPKGKVLKKSSVDQKLAKKMAANKQKFTSKKDAEEAYKKTLSQNKYTSEPSSRPSHIPQSYSSGGTTYQTVFVGGQYGYHVGGVFRPYTYADYVVDRALLEAAGWWDYDHIHYHNGMASYHAPVRTVRTAPTNASDVLIVLIIIGSVVGIAVVAFMIAKSQRTD